MSLDHFRHQTQIEIRYGDMDALQHVNNAKYLTYIEQARVKYFRDLALWGGEVSQLGIIVAKITMEYKLPVTLDDIAVTVWTRCMRLGNSSFELENAIIRRDGQLAAQGQVVMVVFNYIEQKTVRIPDEWRAKVSAYEPALSSGS